MITCDIAIIGGGIMGSSLAYHLANDGFRGKVFVIERDPTYAYASTALSMGGVRQQFAAEANIKLARWSVDFYEHFGELMETEEGRPDISFCQTGYLFLASEAQRATLAERVAKERSLGVDVEVLSPGDIRSIIPEINLEGIACGSFCPTDGYLDPYAVMMAFQKKARSLGVNFVHDEVVGIVLDKDGTQVRGLKLAREGTVHSAIIVDAAGPWAGGVARMAGLEVSVFPVRRQLYLCVTEVPVPLNFPMVVDVSGLHFRRETGGRLLIGKDKEDEPAGYNFKWDRDWFVQEIWELLANRMPCYDRLRLERGWAGLYEVNRFDSNGLIGPYEGVDGFYLLCGFSGHGVMQAPAAAKLLSSMIVGCTCQELSDVDLSPARIRLGKPVVENMII